MNGFKFLVDTNVVIGLEDAQPVQASFAELVRLAENTASAFLSMARQLIVRITDKRTVEVG
jgi:hypothetical protein